MRVTAVLVVASTGCIVSRANPEHCSARGGDAFCSKLSGDRSFCALDGPGCDAYDPRTNHTGCVGTPPSAECRPSCNRDECDDSAADVSSDEVGEDTSESDSTAAASTESGPPQTCQDDAQCDDPELLCEGGRCLACNHLPDGAAACAERFDERPYCSGEGTCVQCLNARGCSDDPSAPICDLVRAECRGCREHDECQSGGCLRRDGTCVPDDRVFHIDDDASGPGDGSLDAPFQSVAQALASIDHEPALLMLAGGTYPPCTIGDGRKIVIRDQAGRPTLRPDAGDEAVVVVMNGATLYLEGVRLRTDRPDPALVIDRATVEIDRTVITGSPGTALFVNDSTVVLRNSIVGGNARLGPDPAIYVDASSLDVLYTTIAGNLGVSFACGSNGAAITVRNSIVVGESPPSIGCALTATTSVIDTNIEGTDVTIVDTWDSTWFRDPEQGDYHLRTDDTHPFRDIAVWLDGDPPLDVDGQARVGIDGDHEHPGADRP